MWISGYAGRMTGKDRKRPTGRAKILNSGMSKTARFGDSARGALLEGRRIEFGETFGIGSLQPGFGHRELCQSLLCAAPMDFLWMGFWCRCCGRPRGGRRQDTNPYHDPSGSVPAADADHVRDFCLPLSRTTLPPVSPEHCFGDLLSGSLMRWILGLSFLSVIFPTNTRARSRRLAAGVPSFRR
jgi:hypothetical protein